MNLSRARLRRGTGRPKQPAVPDRGGPGFTENAELKGNSARNPNSWEIGNMAEFFETPPEQVERVRKLTILAGIGARATKEPRSWGRENMEDELAVAWFEEGWDHADTQLDANGRGSSSK